MKLQCHVNSIELLPVNSRENDKWNVCYQLVSSICLGTLIVVVSDDRLITQNHKRLFRLEVVTSAKDIKCVLGQYSF